MVERQLPKLHTTGRFRSPAPSLPTFSSAAAAPNPPTRVLDTLVMNPSPRVTIVYLRNEQGVLSSPSVGCASLPRAKNRTSLRRGDEKGSCGSQGYDDRRGRRLYIF